MNGAWTIAALEWRRAWRGRRLQVALALAGMVGAAAAFDGAARAARRQREEADATAAMRTFWLEQGQENPHGAAHFGVFVFAPTPALAGFEPGLLPYLPTTSHLEAHQQNLFEFRPSRDEASGRMLSLSPAGVLQTLAALMVLVLAHDAIAREREAGRLRLLLASGISRRAIVVGKAVGLLAVIAVLALPLLLLPAAVSVAVGGAIASVGLLALVAVHAAALAAWLWVCVAVSAASRTSRGALIALLALWLGQTVVLPRAAVALGPTLHPLPSHAQFKDAIATRLREGIDGHAPDAQKEALKAKVLAQYGVQSVEELPVNFDAIAMQAGEEHGNQVFDAAFGALFDTLEAQRDVELAASALSWPLALTNASRVIAGTDLTAHRRFVAAAEAYRRQLVKAMNGEMERRSRTGDWSFTVGREVWEQVPAFVAPPPQWDVAGCQALVALLAWLVLSAAALLRSARALDGTL